VECPSHRARPERRLTAVSRWERLWTNVHLATFARGAQDAYGAVEDGAIAVRDGRIAWVGPRDALPPDAAAGDAIDCGGRWLTPALVDCHTHLVFGGDRSAEFEARLSGVTYEQIAAAGGGIVATVRATRAATAAELLAQALPRALALAREGVTTLEIKSGYGLDADTEERMLRVARQVGESTGLRVRVTYLALHALPPERRLDRDAYVAEIADRVLPRLHAAGLVDAVDVYCERIAFSVEECARVLGAARALGLPVKVHADQLSDGGGAALAARFGALSAEHLEYTSEDGVAALARAGSVAVLLPVAYVVLRETRAPPVAAFRRHGVPIAIATDCNPGTSPCTSLLATLPLAAAAFRLTPAEALAGVTREAARALGLGDELGTLELGRRADFALWDVAHPRELTYWLGRNPLAGVVRDGVPRAIT
jgi:imidazolonepropionase